MTCQSGAVFGWHSVWTAFFVMVVTPNNWVGCGPVLIVLRQSFVPHRRTQPHAVLPATRRAGAVYKVLRVLSGGRRQNPPARVRDVFV